MADLTKMEKLGDDELDMISGGSYHIYNNDRISWDNVVGVYELNCSRYEAQAVMDSMIGQFATTAEYDNACFMELCNRGWLK